MGGTILGECRKCGLEIDIDPLLEATDENRICDDCKESTESGLDKVKEEILKSGVKLS